jgi:hypothetical protein
MSVIRKDKHSLYVKTNGNIYRPVHGKYTYLLLDAAKACDEGSKLTEGMKVKARAISQSPHAKVGDEYWASHGMYIDGKPSEECWEPKLPPTPEEIAIGKQISAKFHEQFVFKGKIIKVEKP